MTPAPIARQRGRQAPWLPIIYIAAGVLGAFGGARPTGLSWLDPVLLGLGGAALAASGERASTVPLYVAAATAVVLQPATVPLALGALGLVAAWTRRWEQCSAVAGAVAGGLTWAGAVGVPGAPGSSPIVLPMAACLWVVWSAQRHGSESFRQRARALTAAASGVLVAAGLLGALAAATARTYVERGADLLQAGLDAGQLGDTETALADFQAAREALFTGQSNLGALWARPAWIVPGMSQNLRVLHDLTGEAEELAGVAVTTAESADLQALQAKGGRIDLAAVAAVEEPLLTLHRALEQTSAAVSALGDAWMLPPVRSGLEELTTQVTDAIASTELAIEGVRVAPELLGADRQATYLVLFTTPVEARATSGFPGNFAEVTFDDGRFDMTRFGRISELVDALPEGGGTLSGPADYLARYGRFKPNWEWRNTTMSPDFPSVASVVAELYPQSGGVPVDGVMTVDPVALAALLSFTGPIVIPGISEPLTSDNAAEFLLREQYLTFGENPDRIDALEVLAETTFDRLQAGTLPGPRGMASVLGPVVEQKHLQVFAFADGTGEFLDALGLSGRYPAVEGDFVGVTHSNAAGNKIDLFLKRSLDYDVVWEPATGALSATVTITLTNEAPASGLPDYVIGNSLERRMGDEAPPAGWNNLFLTLYTPWDDRSATLDGEPITLSRIDELNRRALSIYVPIGPGATRTVTVELAGFLAGPQYVLDLAAQPLVSPEAATVSVRVAGASRLRAAGPVEVAGERVGGSFLLLEDTRIATVRR